MVCLPFDFAPLLARSRSPGMEVVVERGAQFPDKVHSLGGGLPVPIAETVEFEPSGRFATRCAAFHS